MDLTPQESELRSLKERFARRQLSDSVPYPRISPFQLFSRFEKEYWQGVFLKDHFGELEGVRFLEVGAGSGANVYGVLQLGIQPQNLYGNELLPSLASELEGRIARERIFVGDVRSIDPRESFDVVFASTVFSSILNQDLAREVAAKMWSLLKPGGVILWYDLRVDNPNNREVRGIPLAEIRSLFPESRAVRARKITLAPPIGRRVGRLYNFVNFPFLRSHLLALLAK